MFAIIGLLVVIGCVVGGYLMSHGNLAVLWQPAEFIIILGAAIGTFLIASPVQVIKLTLKGFASAFKHFDFTGYALFQRFQLAEGEALQIHDLCRKI